MDLMNYLVSLIIIGVAIQFGELWMGLGSVLILIVASKDIKISALFILSFILFYYLIGIGLSEYWLFAVIGLVALGFIFGIDAGGQEQSADPYAGLMGGMGGY
jgi:hypothetical protein